MGADTSVIREKTRKKSSDTGTERRPENTKKWKRVKEKPLDTNGLCA